MPETREELVPTGRAIWQRSDQMKVYQCPVCLKPVFSQYEGEDKPTIACNPGFFTEVIDGVRYARSGAGTHTLTWTLQQ